MLDSETIRNHVAQGFGWDRAQPFTGIPADHVAGLEAWRVRDAYGSLLVASEEARTALMQFRPPLEAVNPLSDADLRYRVEGGFKAAFFVDSLMRRHMGDKPVRFLDFGCGSGRVVSVLAQFCPDNTYAGCDVVEGAIDYLKSSGIPGRFERIENRPPTPFEAGSFDVILAWSIFTHYSQEFSDLWAVELARLLRPGGLLLMTFHPPATMATLREDSRPAMPTGEALDRMEAGLRSQNFGYSACYDDKFAATGADLENFGMTVISPDYLKERWSEHLELVETQTAVQHWQDMAVFRAR